MSIIKFNKQFLLLLVVFASIFLSQGVVADQANCDQCKKLHLKSLGANRCYKGCKRRGKNGKIVLEPKCENECCLAICKTKDGSKDAAQICTELGYCAPPTASPTASPVEDVTAPPTESTTKVPTTSPTEPLPVDPTPAPVPAPTRAPVRAPTKRPVIRGDDD